MSGGRFATVRRIAIAATFALAVAACSKAPELVEFTPPGESFTVMMPGTPRHEQGSMETAAGTITSHVWVSEFDGVVYAVNYQHMPEAAQHRLAEIGNDAAFAEGQRNLMRSSGARQLVRSGNTAAYLGTRTALDGREYVLGLDGGATMTVRLFIHRDVYYQIATTVPAEPWYNQELFAERFLDSFTVEQ